MKKTLLMLLGVCLFVISAVAQEKTVTGRVTDNSGPLPGVSVKVKGTSTGTTTGTDGNYTIRVNQGAVLQFSFIGSTTQERTVGAENTINVTLGADTKALDEIVVVGYGTQRKGNLTGAISTIDVKKTLEGRPVADAGRALQGAAPGLSVVLPSGEVGSDPIIKIRGQIGSFSGGSSPLILLDNVEIPSIQLVNSADIESITILKDAAASSIYGAKAAFGVVLITTKKGTGSDKPQVTYSSNLSFQNPWKELEMGRVNALKYTVDAFERTGGTVAGAFYITSRESYERAVAWEQKYGSTVKNTDPTVYGRDWYYDAARNYKHGVRTYDPYESMVEEWAPTQLHNLSLGGTTGKTSYNLGLAALDQSGMMKAAKVDQFTRYNASLRVTSEINKYFTARGGAIYSRRNKEYPYITSSTTADPWLYMYRWSSLYPYGKAETGEDIRSPASEAAAANTANILQNYLNFNLGGTFNIASNWTADFDYSFSNQEGRTRRPGTKYTARDSWVAPIARVDGSGNPVFVNAEGAVVPSTTAGAIRAYDLPLATYTSTGANPDHLYKSAENFYRHTINAITTYNLTFKEDHQFKLMGGLNRVTDNRANQFTQITNLTNLDNPQFGNAIGIVTGGGDEFWEAQLGYFSRLNYAFKNKYLLEGNIRYDGSSKFPSDLKWRWFPSFSAGWVASEESFMKWTQPVLNTLKFRGSYGSIGDQSVPNNLYVPTMNSGQTTWINASNAREVAVGSPGAVAADITWQDIRTLNLGVDAGLLDNRINIGFDIFRRNTDNMIIGVEGIPATFGTTAPRGNYGDLKTEGWELSIDFNHRFTNGLGINLRGNLSDAKTTIINAGSTQTVTGNYKGKTYGEIWGYRTDRLYQNDDFELDASGKPQLITLTAAESALHAGKQAYKLKTVNGQKPVYQPFVQNSATFRFGPGDVKFVDLNGDGEISNGSNLLSNYGDLEVIGNFTPRYEYGFRLGGDFKGIDIGAFFQGVGSRQIWGEGFLAIPGFNSADGAMPAAIADDYWTPTNTNAFYPAAFNNGGSGTTNNMQVQSRYLLDMSYLRLKSLTLGYALPKTMLNKVGINSLRFYVAGENLITWDKLGRLPIDPEQINGYSMFNTDNYNSGRTGVSIPTFKSFSFGAQLNF
ncbi:SusC/RagA family TonB-linked outer membrane protein [Daejeonella lutea]|uniref:TonB-linked outer membrane protein, SusC/RagA family n=1 Tax=Daejeonella lutea TaxID=572036 RepID=A0A1T5DWD8_9SPHI|nr:TonB-dependent receptor [Daejeonella lutea]SKB75954.1 TonB-linked outer membrane protein, SusC/RagA family [Daejeonella lutea]